MIEALWNHLPDHSHPPRLAGCTLHDVNHGSDCTFNSTTVGLGLTMQVKGGALLGRHVEAVKFAQL